MEKDFLTVKDAGEREFVIEKSRFIGYVMPVAEERAAQSFVAQIKKKHWDATHNVWAYVLGDRNEVQRFSDDGEPQGTAGIPVLEVLKKREVRNVCVVVTRYFGGVKLGAGGLVRAYTRGAAEALDAGVVVRRRLYEVMGVEVAYPLLGMMQKQLEKAGFLLKDTVYTEQVWLDVAVLAEERAHFEALVTDWCSGRCHVEKLGEEYMDTVQSR